MRFLHTVLWALLRIVPQRFKRWFYPRLAKASAWLGGELYLNIYRLPFGLVLKSTFGCAANEAHGLLVAGSINGVQTPFLVDHVSASSRSYILMSWIDGDCVSDIWESLVPRDKERIVLELRTQIVLMRQHTLGHTRSISSTSGDPISDPRVPWICEDPRICLSTRDFFKEVWCGLDFEHMRETIKPAIQPLVDREDIPIVFCHGDILPKNLILPGGLARWRSGSIPLYLIDWDYSGWLPLPWEALKATWMICDRDEEEWYRMMQDVFPESLAELEADWLWRTKSGIPIV